MGGKESAYGGGGQEEDISHMVHCLGMNELVVT